MSTYREKGETTPDGPEPLKPGPAASCPACGARAVGAYARLADGKEFEVARHHRSALPAPVACSPHKRVRLGWFSRCEYPGEHLHESCKRCGYRWLTAFAE